MTSTDLAVDAVRAAADTAANWAALSERARSCVACPELAASRTSVVVGVAPQELPMLLVGEAPGAAEDESGLPFVGKAGALLDTLLADAGVERGAVGVVNVLKCRPPGNRAPTRAEARRCTGWLDRQVALAAPAVVVTLGGTAAAWAFGGPVRLGDVRGRSHPFRDLPGCVLVPTYHPSAAIRFGPNGEPCRLLALDLAYAAQLVDASTAP